MEIRDFANAILTGTRIEDKLLCIGRITDDRPGPALLGTVIPGRPQALAFRKSKTKHSFPKLSMLDDARVRGRVLHFFANHELLALELMALTLLKFPHAPPRFRRTLVATMRDEQKHMKLYLAHMNKLGVEFGEIPVNGFFWSVISPMTSPIDFVARMSLTFEQANLDFSMYFRDAFTKIGDHESAAIMDEVLIDEVRHVRHGLQFFEKWRDPELSTWDAHRSVLPFPLSPARAKGSVGFTTVHRARAGLSEDYIERLRLYQHSKGRSPTVYLFNPMAENQLGKDRERRVKRQFVQGFERDTETLPMFLTARDDVVLVRRVPTPKFLCGLVSLGFKTPEFVLYSDMGDGLVVDELWTQRKFRELRPWGWDSRTARLLEPIRSQLIQPTDALEERVRKYRHLSSKSWLVSQLDTVLSTVPKTWRQEFFTLHDPEILTTIQSVIDSRDRLYSLGYEAVAVKAPFGTAGGGTQRLLKGEDQSRQMVWIGRILDTQGAVVVEPWYYRLMDLSFQFSVEPDGRIKHHGITRFLTDISGRYRGTFITQFSKGLSSELRSFIFQSTENSDWLTDVCRRVVDSLGNLMGSADYSGRAGIDLMIVRDLDGTLRLRLPLELNCRATMGHIALSLGRRVGPRSVGIWLWVSRGDLKGSEYDQFDALLDGLAQHLPTKIVSSCGRLEQGAIATTDATQAEFVMTVLLIATSEADIDEAIDSVGLTHQRWPINLTTDPGFTAI